MIELPEPHVVSCSHVDKPCIWCLLSAFVEPLVGPRTSVRDITMVVFDREYRSLASGQLRWHDGAVGAFSDPRFTDLVPSLFSGSLEGHVVSVRAVLDTRAHQKARSAATRVMLEWRVLGNVLAGVSAAAVGETGDGSRPVPSWPIALIEPAEGATTFIAMAEET